MFSQETVFPHPMQADRKESSDMKHRLLMLAALCMLAALDGLLLAQRTVLPVWFVQQGAGDVSKLRLVPSGARDVLGMSGARLPEVLGQSPGVAGHAPGPPVGQTTYPYYTTRGPRDFLARDPGSIGP